MLIFVAWRPDPVRARPSDPVRVATALSRRFAPLFPEAPEFHTRTVGGVHLAWHEVPVGGWNGPRFAEDGSRFVLAPDFPLNLRELVEHQDSPDRALLELAEALEQRPAAILRELVPPASLVWSSANGMRLQTDGLGQSQLFEAEHDGTFAVTNRLAALESVGIPIEPDPLEWATRFTLGWFPGDTTGFRRVRFVMPGTRIDLETSGVRRSTFDVLSDWLHPDPMPPDACLELATDSMRRLLRCAMGFWDRPSVGLSGGWDSRGVVALLRDLGSSMSLRVRGNPERYDVRIAAELARIAGLKLRIKNKGGIPTDSLDECRRAIELALLFQAGGLPTKKHKTFLRRKPHLQPGVVNVMGQHAGLGKADFSVKIRAWELEPRQYEARLLDTLTEDFLSLVRQDLAADVRRSIRSAYRAANDYGLEGLARLHFFFLHEYTRRWGSAATACQTGIVVTPYLTPDFIRAAYAFPQERIRDRPFHKFVHARYAPDWADVPYEDEVTEDDLQNGRIPPVTLPDEKRQFHDSATWKRTRAHMKYSNTGFWRSVGQPLIEEAVTDRGLWAEMLRDDLITGPWSKDLYRRAADPVAITHLVPRMID